MKKHLLLTFAFVMAMIFQSNAQQRNCAAHEIHEQELASNPDYARKQQQIEAATRNFVADMKAGRVSGSNVIIPCIVHVVYANAQENISDAQVQSQIDRLNLDYSGNNSDIGNTPSEFSVAGNTNIQFELIETKRYSNSRAEWGTNNLVKSTYPPIEPERILNMWVADIGGGILGYAQFPGGALSTDGVVMSPQYFGDRSASGSGSFYLSAPYDLGRTATHEVGHWLNLRHIWGDGNCSADDFVSDTPTAAASNGGCPTYPSKSCSNNGGFTSDMFMNYMDYVQDNCMYMFSSGQNARMQATFQSGGGRSGFMLDPVYNPGGGSGGGPVACASTVSAFPYSESFESGLGAWSQGSGDDLDWTRDSAGTPSSGTGPSTGAAGSFYMFVEASSPNYPSKTTYLNSPCFNLASATTASFSFGYHMNGTSVGTLKVQASTDGSTWADVFSTSGSKGDVWNTATVNLASYTGDEVRLRFVGTTGTSWSSDIAIDNISMTATSGVSCGVPSGLNSSSVTYNSFTVSWSAVSGASSYDVEVNGSIVSDNTTGTSANITGAAASTTYSVKVRANCSGASSAYSSAINVTTPSAPVSGACTGGISSFPYSESFESGLGAWSQGSGDDNNWTRDSGGTPSSGTGPSTGSAGSWYMFLETSGSGTGFPSKTAYLNSPCFNLSSASDATFSFDYHMNGTSMGSLILQVSTNNGSSWSNAWSISGSQGNAWKSVDVDFGAYAGGAVQTRFLATSGSSWSSDIAVDNISVTTGSTGGGGANITVTLTLAFDQYPAETAWTLKNSSGTTVASGNGYTVANSTINETFSLPAGCYDFAITDSYGDGICCTYGNGSYTLASGGSTLATGGAYASGETKNFCVGSTRTVAKKASSLELNLYPNPANVNTTLRLFLEETSNVSVKLFDLQGREVKSIQLENASGAIETNIELSGLKSGIYLMSVATDSGIKQTRKLIVE